ncbi:hypothetical protein [Bacillus phage vB_BanS-Thrax4]|nr:hypothetical protein [Bacillus phage vB_BanS-Thrax4]
MKKKAYVLLKGDKMIGKFHNSKRAVKKNYPKQVVKDGYSIGVFTFSHSEDPKVVDTITLYTDYMGVNYSKRGEAFYAVDDSYRTDMSSFYKFEVNEEDVEKSSYDRYFIKDTSSVEMIGKEEKN